MSSPLPAYNSMVASATVLPAQRRLTPQYASWQEQAWGFYDQLGEFESAVSWRANTMSRVRLLAAKLAPGGDEPEPVDSGPAAEAVGRLAGGTGGQSQLMAELTAHLTVVGETWVVGEDDPENDMELWSVRSADELRVQSGPTGSWQLRDDPRATAWRTPKNVMVVRVWDPHPRRGWEADPAARHAFSAMTKLDLANKRIIATLISRLASNGILLYDKERLSLPTTPQTPAAGPVGAPDALGGGEPDPWAALFVDVASRGIKDPTSPEAVIPVPIGYSLADLANVDPKLLIQHITFASDVDDKLLAQRQDALRELATALDMPVEALLGVGDLNHWCVDDQTEILTADGWHRHTDLVPGQMVLTLNHTTGLSEWQPVQAVNRWQVDQLPMVSIEGRYHSSLTTGSHRWPVLRGSALRDRQRRWTTSAELASNDFLITGAPSADLPLQAKYSDSFVELMAWYMTEGTCHRRVGRDTARVNIYQSHTVNADNVARISRCLTNLFGPPAQGHLDSGGRRAKPDTLARRQTEVDLRAQGMTLAQISEVVGVTQTQICKDLRIASGELVRRSRVTEPRWRIARRANGMTVFKLNAAAGNELTELAPDRIVPTSFVQDLTAAQLDLFIDTAIRGDGSVMGGRTRVFGQKNSLMTEAFALAAILSGRSITYSMPLIQGFTQHVQNLVSVRERAVYRPSRYQPSRPYNNITERIYSGTIWCPTTANGSWLARRNGSVYYTGNSAWAVEESGIKIHVAPPAELICHALTVGYLKPYLEAAGEDPTGLIVWYDPSELTLRPDRSANTLQAYQALEASGPALRREFGLSEDDKPDEAELKSMILKKQAGMESLSSTALAELTGTTEAVAPAPGGATAAPEPGAGGADGQQGPPNTLDQPPPDGGQQTPDRAALAAMDPAVLATLADDVAAVLAAVSPGSRWVDPLTPVVARRGRD